MMATDADGEAPADPSPPPVILDEATAKRRLAIYTLVRLMGIVTLMMGIFLLDRGGIAVGAICTIAGAASLFIRPRNLGLTRPPEP
jgi:hypothetical protein